MKTVHRIPLSAPSPGTRRELLVHHYGDPDARPKAYLHAALHADEHPGLLVLHHLLCRLDAAAAANEIRGQIVVLPYANPIGLGQFLNGYLAGRHDFDGGGNFNRDFPDLGETVRKRIEGRLHGNADIDSSIIREALQAILAQYPPRFKETNALKLELLKLSIDADYVFDLHCDSEALLHLYAANDHYTTACELAAEIGAEVILVEDDAGGSPFDEANAGPWRQLRRWLGEQTTPLACFATTLELRGQSDVSDRLAEADAANLYRFLQRRGIIAGEPGPLPSLRATLGPLEGVDILTAPKAGILAYHKELGDKVKKAEIVADLVDLTEENPLLARTPVRSQTDGVLFARLRDKLVRPGQSFCKIVGSEKLAHRIPGQLLEN